jgi:pimeloyl-ACP methyl ester carboxylesterase
MTAAVAPVEFEVDVDVVPMSGLVAAVAEPRAVIVALHGGGSRPDYFDAPGSPRNSLLRVGALLGFTVVAPYRPGYGLSRDALGERVNPELQVELVYRAVEEVLRGNGQGAGKFLVGHSQGCVLAMRMAVDGRGAGLLGLELAGTGVRHSDRSQPFRDGKFSGSAAGAFFRELLWEPASLYPEREMVTSNAHVL